FVYSASQALTIMDMSSENNSSDKKITGWTVGTAIGNTPVINNYVRGGSGKYTYSIDSAHPLPAGLSIDSNKGTVSGTPTAMVAKSPTPYYTVVVTDQSSPAQTASVNVYYDGVAGNAPVSSVDITKDGYSSSGIVMVEGEEVQLGAKVLPEDAADKTVTWSVDGNYLTITADGKVGTKSTIVFPAGESTVRENVTVRTNSGGKTDSITVIVVKKEQTPTGVVNDCGTAIMMLDPNSTYYIQSGLSVNTFTTDANGCYTIENKYRNLSCTIRKKSPVSSEYYGMIGDPTSEPQTISIPATVTHDWSSFVIDTNTSGPGTEGEISKHCRHNFCDERSEITTIYEPAKATGLEWDGKIAKWNAVPHADAYWITLYKASDDTDVKLYTNITDTQCDFSSDISSSTNYYFKVQAVSKNADILGTIFQRETMSEKSPIYGAQTHYDANGLWRRAGAGRYETSLLIAADYVEQKGGKLDTVVIASGEDFPDALGGGYLAIVNDAPLITVGPNSNVSSQTNVINFLKANAKAGAKVYILGGTGAVSQSFENKVKSAGFTVERCSGQNRYDTNLDTLDKAGVSTLSNGVILISAGNDYADSLSASSTGKPMLLANNALTAEQVNYLTSLKNSGAITSCKIVGGPGAVSTTVEGQLNSIYGKSKVDRLQGPTRYETSVEVAKYCISTNGLSKPDQIVLTYAYNFPDGLSVGPFAYKLQAGTPLILAVNNTTAINAAAPTVKGWGTNKAYITGGPTLISDATAKAILK
ncbi:MAG: cell wall-binding repeat-containing protein, partial [Mogibacterium sp.]|nr:cell wall-binding repeat-containing protein [Mogibacterium sp.]